MGLKLCNGAGLDRAGIGAARFSAPPRLTALLHTPLGVQRGSGVRVGRSKAGTISELFAPHSIRAIGHTWPTNHISSIFGLDTQILADFLAHFCRAAGEKGEIDSSAHCMVRTTMQQSGWHT